MQDTVSRGRVAHAREEIVDRLRSQIAQAGPMGVAALIDVAQSGSSETARVSAAKCLVELSVRRRAVDGVSVGEAGLAIGRAVEVAIHRVPQEQWGVLMAEMRAAAEL